MEVTHRRSTLSKVRHSDSVLIIDSEVIAGTGSLGYLCAEGRGNSDDIHVSRPVVDWHLLALAKIVLITCELVTHLLDREAAPKEDPSFAVLREDQVSVIEGSCSADT